MQAPHVQSKKKIEIIFLTLSVPPPPAKLGQRANCHRLVLGSPDLRFFLSVKRCNRPRVHLSFLGRLLGIPVRDDGRERVLV